MATFLEKFFNFNSRTITPEKYGDGYFYPLNLGTEDTTHYLKQFFAVPELNAIINIRAKALTSAKLELISNATGKPIANQETLAKILRKPNFYQSQKELFQQNEIFRNIYGNEYYYFLTPFGLPNTYKGIYALHPNRVIVEYKTDTAYFHDFTGDAVKYFYLNDSGQKIELDKSNLIHLNDNNVTEIQGGGMMQGVSKLMALQPAIQNIIKAYRKRNIVLSMPPGILTNGASDDLGRSLVMDEDEKKKVFSNLAGLNGLPIITNLATTYNAMNVNSTSMGLFEETREDTGKLCDAFGVPYELLASQKGTTFTNLKEARKQMYEETTIPSMDEKLEPFNDKLATKSFSINASFNHLPVFADDMKQRAISYKQMVEALSKAFADDAITLEQYKFEMTKFNVGTDG